MTKTSPTKRRKFRFSLRTLLLVIVLLSLPLGWFALKIREAERQRRAVEAIREVGGTVWYDYETDDDDSTEPPTPAWLRRLFGEDCFSDVAHILIHDTNFGDEDLKIVKGLTKLEWLDLDYTHVTDDVKETLKGLTKLEALSLNKTHVTDDVMETLKGLTKLDWLGLGETQITDAGLEHLGGLVNLYWLDVGGTQITDEGVEHLKGFANLKFLYLYDTQVTEQGVEELRKALPNCHIQPPELPNPDPPTITPETNLDPFGPPSPDPPPPTPKTNLDQN